VAKRLAQTSHIFLEGYRPGVVHRLGLDYSSISDVAPSIVYCSISGYGQDGPDSQRVGHNINYEAAVGLLNGYGGDGRDLESYFSSPVPFGDVLAGCLAALAVTAALREAERTGVGSYIDLAISEALLVAMIPEITRSLNTDEGVHHYDAGYGLFETADGHLALGIAHEEPFWQLLCAALDLPELGSLKHDARVARRAEIRTMLGGRLIERTTDYWLSVFGDNVPATALKPMREVPHDPQLAARGMFTIARDENGQSFQTVRTPFARGASTPLPKVEELGESTRAVLAALGIATNDGDKANEAP
jgi:crotonobetainyl-CoA:carnitine CoA-transferase CaiB-like acyl-CoA transferase